MTNIYLCFPDSFCPCKPIFWGKFRKKWHPVFELPPVSEHQLPATRKLQPDAATAHVVRDARPLLPPGLVHVYTHQGKGRV